jgi:phospholipid-binding lipoprotein MlaA
LHSTNQYLTALYNHWRALILIFLMAISVTACATSNKEKPGGPAINADSTSSSASPAADQNAKVPALAPEDEEDNDPFEGFNRAVYKFNDYFDRAILKPVAKGYDFITPNFIKKGISNVFRNLFEPTVIINDVLQGKFKQSASDTGRFVVNSTVGLLGLFDVAKHLNMPAHNEDFGQTLGVWGVKDGPYLVLPFFGPSSIRDGVGLVADWETDPVTYIEDNTARWGTRALRFVDTRAQYLGASEILEQAADDEYVFRREAYRQRRRNLVYDGNPPVRRFD